MVPIVVIAGVGGGVALVDVVVGSLSSSLGVLRGHYYQDTAGINTYVLGMLGAWHQYTRAGRGLSASLGAGAINARSTTQAIPCRCIGRTKTRAVLIIVIFCAT